MSTGRRNSTGDQTGRVQLRRGLQGQLQSRTEPLSTEARGMKEEEVHQRSIRSLESLNLFRRDTLSNRSSLREDLRCHRGEADCDGIEASRSSLRGDLFERASRPNRFRIRTERIDPMRLALSRWRQHVGRTHFGCKYYFLVAGLSRSHIVLSSDIGSKSVGSAPYAQSTLRDICN